MDRPVALRTVGSLEDVADPGAELQAEETGKEPLLCLQPRVSWRPERRRLRSCSDFSSLLFASSYRAWTLLHWKDGSLWHPRWKEDGT